MSVTEAFHGSHDNQPYGEKQQSKKVSRMEAPARWKSGWQDLSPQLSPIGQVAEGRPRSVDPKRLQVAVALFPKEGYQLAGVAELV
jgi:hypothetical protein